MYLIFHKYGEVVAAVNKLANSDTKVCIKTKIMLYESTNILILLEQRIFFLHN